MDGYKGERTQVARRKTTTEVARLHSPAKAALPRWVAAIWIERPDGAGQESIDIEWTRAGFAGWRPCLVCSACGRHMMIGYRVEGEWVCRSCGNLVYPSQRERSLDRLIRKVCSLQEFIRALQAMLTEQSPSPGVASLTPVRVSPTSPQLPALGVRSRH